MKENEKAQNSSSNGNPVPAPTCKEIQEWTKKDLVAASYFLSMLLRYPEIVDDLGRQIFEHANKLEGGAAIDHLNQSENGVH